MKKIFALLLFSFSAVVCLADCAGSGLNFYPEGKTVRQNAVFLIQGYANDQESIRQLGKTYKAYLQSGTQKIDLEVKEILEGQFYITQALLAPTKKLVAGTTYTLHIDPVSGKGSENITRWNGKTHEQVTWTVEDGEDNEAPTWTKKPKEYEKSIRHYGCGPAEYVSFGCAANESSILVKAKVTCIKTKKTVSCYLFLSDKLLSIGHGMCSGAFTFAEKEYEVAFDLMDFSGNTTAWTGNKISFTRPTDADDK